MIRVAVIIAVHNRSVLTRRCLLSLSEACQTAQLEITVIDDGSTDDTAMMLGRYFPAVNVLTGDGNLWFGGAMDLGLRHHLLGSNSAPDYVLIINNDTFAYPGSIDRMLAWSEGHRVVAAMFHLEDKDETGTAGFYWRFPRGLISANAVPKWQSLSADTSADYLPVDSVATTFTLYPSKALQGFEQINLKRHPHNRYDVLLSCVAKQNKADMVVSKKKLGSHILGTTQRYRPCRTMRLHEFITYTLKDPKTVAYLPGNIDMGLRIAPNACLGAMIVLQFCTRFAAQLLLVLILELKRKAS